MRVPRRLVAGLLAGFAAGVAGGYVAGLVREPTPRGPARPTRGGER